jgi:hypothetical protein
MSLLRSFGLLAVTACSMMVACDKKDTGTGAAASASAPGAATGAACPAGQVAIPGPGICLAAPAGHTPLNTEHTKKPDSGQLQVNYSSDGTSGGKFVGTIQVYYGGPKSPPDFKALEDDAKQYCDAPPKLEDIDGGKGKFFQCTSTKLQGYSYVKSKIFTAKNVIDCSSQSEKRPEIDTVCKTLKQL